MFRTDLPGRSQGREVEFTEAFVESFFAKVEVRGVDECHEWKASTGKPGYGHMWTVIGGKKTCRDAHQIRWMIEHGREPKGVVRHSCDNKRCVNIRHLRDGSYQDNSHDALRSGAISRTLDAVKVKSILADISAGRLVPHIAHAMGISTSVIKSMLRGKHWAPVTGITMCPASGRYADQFSFAF